MRITDSREIGVLAAHVLAAHAAMVPARGDSKPEGRILAGSVKNQRVRLLRSRVGLQRRRRGCMCEGNLADTAANRVSNSGSAGRTASAPPIPEVHAGSDEDEDHGSHAAA